MKKIFTLAFMLLLILSLAGCGEKSPAADSKTSPETNLGAAGDALSLPDSYPKEILPLAADAEIIDIRENPANNGLEVDYVSGNNLDTLVDYYEGALKDAKDLSTSDVESGYMVTASMDGVYYTIMLSEGIMDHIPKYAGKTTVSIILSGLKDVSGSGPQLPEGEGEPWPSADLPDVPQLQGHIGQVLREDDIIRLEITVENADVVKNYLGELTAAGFSFDTEPDLESDYMEFLAFKDSSMMSFAYKGEEQLVSIEYQK